MYEASNGTFVDLHTPLGLQTTDGEDVCAITSFPEYYSAMAFADRMKIIVASSLLFVVALMLSRYLSSIRKADIRCG
ncbi:MAG: hypothetical protein ACLUW6_01395 [Coriobacteriaceae bacterium]